MIEVKIEGVVIDNVNHLPIVLLKDEKNNSIMPIWIGVFEAQAILYALEGIHPSRPLTHDLLKQVIESLGGKLKFIVIHALKENTYFAKINIKANGKLIEVDSRPSDAIALALRAQAPIYVTEPVMSTATMPQKPIDDAEVEKFKQWLNNPNNTLQNIDEINNI